MKVVWKRVLAMATVISITASTAGCRHKQEKTPKPQPQATAVVDNGNTDAKGKGEGQADVPLVIGCNKLDGKFNPFIAKSQDDRQAADLTQIYLLEEDRNGQVIYNGIDGEIKTYNNRDYTYYGPADVKTSYNKRKDETIYRITLRDDLKFSDGEPVTIDDVLFTMYVLCDKSYKGSYNLGRQNIKGLLKYQKNKKVKNIAGIKRIDNYTMTVTTDGFDISMIKSLKIPVCPLHYYGNKEKYNYNKNKFGFKKGDTSSVCSNKKQPAGAGAYRFVKYENKIVYYASNELYYKGCPKIAYVQLKEMEDILNTAQEKINKAIEEEQAQGINYTNIGTQAEGTTETASPSDIPEDTINHNPEALEMTEGTVDIINAVLSGEDLFWVAYANPDGEISGNKIATSFVPEGIYQYIGINAENVKTGRNIYSKESRNLRKAFATAFSAFKDGIYSSYTEYKGLIQYPLWLTSANGEEEEMPFYNKDINGNIIYNEDADDTRKYEAVKEAVLSYLEAAGYTINGMSVAEAPDGAKKSYTLMLDGGNSSPLYQMASKTAALFKDIGMEIKITDILKEKPSGNKKSQEIYLWSGKSADNAGYSLYNKYINNNRFGLSKSGVSKMLKQADGTVKEERRQKRYINCYKNLWNLAVEIPLNKLYSIDLYSSARIDIDTMPKDVTVYYNWMDEIEDIEMK